MATAIKKHQSNSNQFMRYYVIMLFILYGCVIQNKQTYLHHKTKPIMLCTYYYYGR